MAEKLCELIKKGGSSGGTDYEQYTLSTSATVGGRSAVNATVAAPSGRKIVGIYSTNSYIIDASFTDTTVSCRLCNWSSDSARNITGVIVVLLE